MRRRQFLQVPIALAAAAATNQVTNARGAALEERHGIRFVGEALTPD